MKKNIFLHEPFLIGNEKKYLNNCIKENWISTAGKYVNIFEKKLCKLSGSKSVVAVLNGTIGLQMSLILSGIKNSDEVIVPTITFIATINAINHAGGRPIFVDTEENLNIDQEKCIKFIKERTFVKNNYTYNLKTKKKITAIIIVHTFGNAANFVKLYNLCKKRNIKIIEDAAESIGTKYNIGKFKNKHTGTIGDFGVISFNGNKTITSGNGGAILIKNKILEKKARYLITQAKNNNIYFIHNEVGYNFKLSNICAAVGVAQLEKLSIIAKKKKKIFNIYKKKIKKINGLELLEGPKFATNNHWLNILRIKSKSYKFDTQKLIRLLIKNKIMARAVWKPNHLQKPFKRFENYKIYKALKAYRNCICLPSGPGLSLNDISYVVKILRKGQK